MAHVILTPNLEGSSSAGNGWTREWARFEILAFRTGWRGAWDAIKAAWKKDRRLQVPQDITVSLYIKEEYDENDRIETTYQWGAQLETGNGTS